jgi:hypothetical protein
VVHRSCISHFIFYKKTVRKHQVFSMEQSPEMHRCRRGRAWRCAAAGEGARLEMRRHRGRGSQSRMEMSRRRGRGSPEDMPLQVAAWLGGVVSSRAVVGAALAARVRAWNCGRNQPGKTTLIWVLTSWLTFLLKSIEDLDQLGG